MSDDNDTTDYKLLRERQTRDLNNPLLPLGGRYEYRQGFVWGILTGLVLYAAVWGVLWLIDNGTWLLAEYTKYV